MVSVEQLRQLRDMIHSTISKLRELQTENEQLKASLAEAEAELSELRQQMTQAEQVQNEVSGILNELQDLQISPSDGPPQAEIRSEVSPKEALEFAETVGKRDPEPIKEEKFLLSVEYEQNIEPAEVPPSQDQEEPPLELGQEDLTELLSSVSQPPAPTAPPAEENEVTLGLEGIEPGVFELEEKGVPPVPRDNNLENDLEIF